ncbi:MAG: ferritin [Culicoidibacterales bacterium]
MKLSPAVATALNVQMNYEFESAHVYLAMAAYASELGLDGFVNFFQVQYQEEVAHAQKFFQYINDRNGRVEIQGFTTPQKEFSSILEAFEVALHHEEGVSSRIHEIVKQAHAETDYFTVSFLEWFIKEQVEEESNFHNLISKIKLLQDGAGLYLLDQELQTRTFKPIPAE